MIKLLKQVPLAFFIAFRMARSKRSPTLSVVTLLSIGGIALGVLSLTVVLGVTGGFQEAFQERILGLYPHLVVHRGNSEIRNYEQLVEDIKNVDGVVAASPVTFDDMMLAAGAHRAGAVVKGLHLDTTHEVIGLNKLLQDNASLKDLEENLQTHRQESEIHLSAPFANTWNTILVHGNDVSWWVEDQTPPKANTSQVLLIDARKGAKTAALKLTESLDVLTTNEPVIMATGTPASPGAPTTLTNGMWTIESLNQSIELTGDEYVTLIISQAAGQPDPKLRIIRSPRRAPLGDEEAMVRLIRLDSQPTEISLVDEKGKHLTSANSGNESAFVSIKGTLPGIILGVALAKKLNAKVGDSLSLLTPLRGVDNQMVGPIGMLPSSARHKVTGIFESGFYDYDVRLAFVNIDAAQRFLNRGKAVRWIEIKTKNLLDLEATKDAIAARIDPYDYETLVRSSLLLEKHVDDAKDKQHSGTQGFGDTLHRDMQRLTALKFQEENLGYHPEFRLMDWEELNQNLFSALKLQKVVLAMFFLIIILVGCFVVVGSQVMIIHDKTPDIAILKTMGAKKVEVGLIFAIQGLLVALIGIVLGLLGGLGICWGIQAFDYRLDPSIYLIDQLPVQIESSELAGIALTTLICTLLAVIYSAWQATRKTPVSGLRSVD